jgi:hypothetical protein
MLMSSQVASQGEEVSFYESHVTILRLRKMFEVHCIEAPFKWFCVVGNACIIGFYHEWVDKHRGVQTGFLQVPMCLQNQDSYANCILYMNKCC